VDFNQPGVYRAVTDLPADKPVVPAGTTVNVHYIHADRLAEDGGLRLNGEVTFPGKILGVISENATLTGTHDTLGNGCTAYPNRGGLGVEHPEDTIELSDPNTLRLSLRTANHVDQIRVITASEG
jgi:hypothetical protein